MKKIKPPQTTKLFIPFEIERYKAIMDGSKAHKNVIPNKIFMFLASAYISMILCYQTDSPLLESKS